MNNEAFRIERVACEPGAERAERDLKMAGLVAAAASGDTTAVEAFYDGSIGYARALARRRLQSAVIDVAAKSRTRLWWSGLQLLRPGRVSLERRQL
jgi:hypothetical protein